MSYQSNDDNKNDDNGDDDNDNDDSDNDNNDKEFISPMGKAGDKKRQGDCSKIIICRF